MSALVPLNPQPLSDAEVTRYIRESMPLDVGVVLAPDSRVNGVERLNLMALRLVPKNAIGKVSAATLIFFERNKAVTRASCCDAVERYLDLFHQ